MKDIFTNPAKYNKFWVALAAPSAALIFACAGTEKEAAFSITVDEWYQVLVAFAVAVGVYQTPNKK